MKIVIFTIGLIISISSATPGATSSSARSVPEISESSSHEANARSRGRAYGSGSSEGIAYAAALAKVPVGAKVTYKKTTSINRGTKNAKWSIWLTWEKE